ncbi:hypothetical protein PENTCL1PPCAC_16043, partial [Pristionchus entomophagus]
MLEDALYQIIPVLGLATILSAILVLAILWKVQGNPRILMIFAVTDVVNGVAFISCGFYGTFVTRSGNENEFLQPSLCILRAPHLLMWAFVDASQVLSLLLFFFDRTLHAFLPLAYDKISKVYLTLKSGLVMCGASMVGVIPSFYGTVTANSSVTVSKLCRFEQVVLHHFYEPRLIFLEWLP